MRRLALMVVLGAVLVVPPAADAKGSAPDRVCGESACVRIEDYPHVMVVLYPRAARSEPPALSFYRVHYPAPGIPPHYFVPARNLIGAGYADARRWFRLDEPALGAIRRAIDGLAPFPVPKSWAQAETGPPDGAARSITAASLLVLMAGAMALLGTFRRRRA